MKYPARESKNLEFKSKLPSFQSLIKTCVAFANGMGGKLIIGVEDKTREIIGVDENTRNRIYDELTNSIYDSTTPSLLTEIYEKNFLNHNVIIIEIFNILNKPVFVTNEGIPKGVYLRAGSNTRRATDECISELSRESRHCLFDEELINEENVKS